MKLTKSHFLTFLDSPLHLWVKVHGGFVPKPLSEYDQHVENQGYEVERLAKEFVSHKVATQYSAGTELTYEAVLTDGNYESRIDALVHDTTYNTYDLYEIKSSSSIKKEHKYDVTFQYLVGKASLPINKVYLVHVNPEYRKQGELNLENLFVVEDMTDHIAKREDEVYQLRQDAWHILQQQGMPQDEHCFNPGTCAYPDACFPGLPEYSIYDLCRGSHKQYQELIELGITEVGQIPDGFTRNYKQKLQIQSARTAEPIINRDDIHHELEQLEFPLYFFDYETYNPALPLYDGYKPYQHLTTQFSLHVLEHPDGEFRHEEFLITNPGDPAPLVAAELCRVIGDTGTIIVWNKSFECGRNAELAELCPQYAEQLHSIIDRTYDLMDVFAQGLYVDYRFHGSASIKKVLPVLCPELSYKELEIGEGATAMLKWYEMVYGAATQEERDVIKKNLLTYCELDTWAMVEIWRKLQVSSAPFRRH